MSAESRNNALFDYSQNIELISDLNDEEKDFLRKYFKEAKEDLKSLYRAKSREYEKWRKWLKRNSYVVYKIKHLQQQTIIKNSKEAFDFVLQNCIDLVFFGKAKNNAKIQIDSLNLINKICGLESYAQQTIANLNQQKQQNNLAQLTTAQLQQLANNVSNNLRLLQQSKTNPVECEDCDVKEQSDNDEQLAEISDKLNKD